MKWEYYGARRPSFAEPAGADQESVWDYPRPPRVVPDQRLVEVYHEQRLIAHSRRAVRVCETAAPPTWYIPFADIELAQLGVTQGSSACEWKGQARYWALIDDPSARPIAWDYPSPTLDYQRIATHLSFYPALSGCYVEGVRVAPQPGDFYGGWVTAELVGPFKGSPGSEHW